MRSRTTFTALASLCATLLLSASSCVDDVGKGAAKGGSLFAKSEGDDALKLGTQRADDLLVQVPEAVKPTLGTRLRSSASEMSGDPEVQDALEGLAWETTCALVFGKIPSTADEVATFLVQQAVNFGISFLDEGEQEMADLVLEAFTAQENEAEEACNDIRS